MALPVVQDPTQNRTTIGQDAKGGARKCKRDPVEAAKRKVVAKASQQEKARVKRAMRENRKAIGKENKPLGDEAGVAGP